MQWFLNLRLANKFDQIRLNTQKFLVITGTNSIQLFWRCLETRLSSYNQSWTVKMDSFNFTRPCSARRKQSISAIEIDASPTSYLCAAITDTWYFLICTISFEVVCVSCLLVKKSFKSVTVSLLYISQD